MTNINKFGDYYLTSHLATGGMAELFRAHKLGEAGFGKVFALKRLLPHMARNQEFVTMFLDEARLASQLSHQNIVQVYDLGRVGAEAAMDPLSVDTYFIAMEYIFGKNLAEIYRAGQEQHAMPSGDNLVRIVLNVAVALDYAHSLRDHDMHPLGVVHRDVSPANILVSYEGETKLVDFGIAKALSQSSATKPGVLKGKFAYMSPEQAKGQPLDARSDIFSLGIVLWEGLTGQRLFHADSEAATLKKVVEFRPPSPLRAGGVSSVRLDEICLKCLASDCALRYQSAKELAQDLEEYLRSLSTYPGTYALRSHLYTLFGELIEQERAAIRQENEALKLMLEDGAEARQANATTVRSHPVLPANATPPPAGQARPAASWVPSQAMQPSGASGLEKGQGGQLRVPKFLYLAGAGLVVLMVGLFLWWPRSQPAAPLVTATPQPRSATALAYPITQAPPPASTVSIPTSPAIPIPGNEALRRQASALLEAGRYQEAWDAMQTLADSDPAQAPRLTGARLAALMGLAKNSMETAPTVALGWLERAQGLSPNAADVYFQKGRALTKLDRLEEALNAYRQATALSPQMAGAHFNMGYILLKLGEIPQAIDSFQRVVNLDGELMDEALTNLGVCYARQGDRSTAAAMFSRALARNPANDMAQKYLEQVRGWSQTGPQTTTP